MEFTKANKLQSKLRMALIGPAGSGKTYTALAIATSLGGKIAVMDTEHGSASKYADIFNFDVITPESFSPTVYIEAIKAAEFGGYSVLILDSLSHAWAGKGGLLEFVDTETARSKSHNAFSEGWRKATPIHNLLIDTILAANVHILATMRTKTEYVMERDERTGKSSPRKVGLQPVQRDGMEYEFDVVADLDQDNRLVVGKTRCPALSGSVFEKAGSDIAGVLTAWLSGAPVPERKNQEPKPATQWSTLVISWAVKEFEGVTSYQVIGALKQSKVLTPDMPDTDIQRWLTVRKIDRDAGVDGATASKHADMDYAATHTYEPTEETTV